MAKLVYICKFISPVHGNDFTYITDCNPDRRDSNRGQATKEQESTRAPR
jgi:hypothetical protein